MSGSLMYGEGEGPAREECDHEPGGTAALELLSQNGDLRQRHRISLSKLSAERQECTPVWLVDEQDDTENGTPSES